MEIYKVFPQDRVRRSGLRTRSLTLQFQVEVFTISSNSYRAGVSSDLPDEANHGVFSTFPRVKKSAKIPRTEGSELGAQSSSWTP